MAHTAGRLAAAKAQAESRPVQQPAFGGVRNGLGLRRDVRVAGQLVQEGALAAEVLPVRCLDPALDHVLLRQRERVLQARSEAISRAGSPGRPVVDPDLGLRASSKDGQGTKAASSTRSGR